MPIYAYRCESCGHSQDVLQKLADAPLTICPHCCAPAFRKQVTAAGFRLKGSGWYATDFRNEGNGKASDAAHGKTEGANGKTEGAADRNGSTHKEATDAGTTGGSGAADAGTGASSSAPPASGGTDSKP